MADIELTSFPFDSMDVLNSQSGQMEPDRLYNAEVFRKYFSKFLSNGVYYGHYKNYGENSMKVQVSSSMSIVVKAGAGIIEGADFENESDQIISLERPEIGQRVDRIVVRLNKSLNTRKTLLIVKQGDGTTPSELVRNDNIYEICIAEVTVDSLANLSSESIVDKRTDTTLCGIVNSLISVDGEELYEQFQEYIETVKSNLISKDDIYIFEFNGSVENANIINLPTEFANANLNRLKPIAIYEVTPITSEIDPETRRRSNTCSKKLVNLELVFKTEENDTTMTVNGYDSTKKYQIVLMNIHKNNIFF